ncbi:GTP cyclohydrolase I [Desulfobaculum xiamenense]|uniref:GTP cyclohydrolase FolE2 n=1 Tax=Desulfobaculum xiamenense TaxID=995050 RepID=A0A846QLE7_9BACT|nr:GTP cyclohydrolase FolE2 [Desulfobaculum xiamenense]NJB67003.1 GTP cyclohydrolase I [Desulfobaculum xiamenense]
MKDVQSGPAEVAMPIDRVGVKNLRLPVLVRSRDNKGEVQHTVASVDLSVDLPARFKGTHMSRFIEALRAWSEELDYSSFKRLLEDVRLRLQAERAHLIFRFPYFLQRLAPETGTPALMDYQCTLLGELESGKLTFELGVDVPVMTVCPCSLAICNGGAHSQRAIVRIRTRSTGMVWIEDLIAIAEQAGSSPVYALLKREDERRVTEDAFAKPAFVEDVVRSAADELRRLEQVSWFRVEVESQESIHNHSAYAIIELDKNV